MLTEIKKALLRKFGPLPAWAWAAGLAGALYLYRRHQASTSSASTPVNVPATAAQLAPQAVTAGAGSSGDTGAGSGGTNGPTPVVYDPVTDSYNPPSSGQGPGTLLPPSSGQGPGPAPVAPYTTTQPRTSPLVARQTPADQGGPLSAGQVGRSAARAIRTSRTRRTRPAPLSAWQLAHPHSVLTHDSGLSAYQTRRLQRLEQARPRSRTQAAPPVRAHKQANHAARQAAAHAQAVHRAPPPPPKPAPKRTAAVRHAARVRRAAATRHHHPA